ncbi:MAG: hypothetical protein ABFC89_12050 [Methanospirillum sp.]
MQVRTAAGAANDAGREAPGAAREAVPDGSAGPIGSNGAAPAAVVAVEMISGDPSLQGVPQGW